MGELLVRVAASHQASKLITLRDYGQFLCLQNLLCNEIIKIVQVLQNRLGKEE